jgi:hypothetical protein
MSVRSAGAHDRSAHPAGPYVRALTWSALALLAAACEGTDPAAPPGGPPAASVVLTPPTHTLVPGESVQLVAVALDSAGDTLSSKRIVWTVSHPAVVGIDSAGILSARAPGSAQVQAQADAASDAVAVTVVDATADCAAQGEVHLEPVRTAETWRAGSGPHHVPRDLTIEVILTIEAGATVCIGPDAVLELRAAFGTDAGMRARGTPADSILFTARERGRVWGGIGAPLYTEPVLDLGHVRIEHASTGVTIHGGRPAIDSSLIRHIGGFAIVFAEADGRVLDSVLDSVRDGIQVFYGRATVAGTRIRPHSMGIVALRATLSLRDVVISGAGAIGLNLGGIGYWTTLVEARDVVITGGRTYPFFGDPHAATMLTDPALDNRLAGNALDLIVVGTYAQRPGDIVVRAGLPWVAPEGLFIRGQPVRLEPGALLTVDESIFGLVPGTPFIARGSPDAPSELVYTGSSPVHAVLGGSSGDAHHIAHAIVTNITLAADSGVALRLDSSRVNGGGGVVLRAPGSRILDSTVEDAAGSEAVLAAAPGITLDGVIVRNALGHGIRIAAPGTTLSRCRINGSAGDGVVVDSAMNVRVSDCGFEDNGGVGMRNLDGATVDARFNWWGDPAGPTGPAGDGVAGSIRFEPFRLVPVPAAGSTGHANTAAAWVWHSSCTQAPLRSPARRLPCSLPLAMPR